MLHIELNKPRETVWRFNLTEQQLYATVLVPWKRGESIELGDQYWPPEETTIVILDGPHLPPGLLTMGRGWLNAKRQGTDVTQDLLANFEQRFAAAEASRAAAAATGSGSAATRAAGSASAPNGSGVSGNGASVEDASVGGKGGRGGSPSPGVVKPAPPASSLEGSGASEQAVAAAGAAGAGASDAVLADAFGLELLKAMSDVPLSLNAAWRLAGERHPQLEAGATLKLAMNAVASLVSSGLVVLGSVTDGGVEMLRGSRDELVERAREMDGWLADTGPGSLRISRA